MKSTTWSLLLLLIAFAPLRAETVGDLVAKGCPSPEREWQAKDYTIVKDLLVKGTLPLPRVQSESGRMVLDRLVNTENLSFHRNRNLPLEPRFTDLLELLDGSKSIMLVYLRAANSGEKVEKELAALLVFHLAVASAMIEITEEFLPTIPKDEKYETRMEGFEKMKKGLATVLDGVITSLSERTIYSDESVAKIARGIREYYPRFASLLPDTSKAEFRRRITAMLDKEKNSAVKSELTLLSDAMKAERSAPANASQPIRSETPVSPPRTTTAAQSYLEEFPRRRQFKYFDFYYKRSPERIEAIARFADAFVGLVNRDFFKADYDYPIRVLVLENQSAFGDFLRRRFRMQDPPGFGVFLSQEKMFVTYEDSGLGTFTHEIMHPLVERNLKDRPLWALEGIPTFFEKFYGYWKADGPAVQWGYQNPWRIEALGTNLTRLDLQSLLATRDSQGQFRESDLRMVSMFLWQQGKFQRFLQLIQKREKNGYGSYFEAAMEMPVERVIPLWKSYLNDVAARRNAIMRLPTSTIVKDEPTFKEFTKAFGIEIEK